MSGQLIVTSKDGQTHIGDGIHVPLLPVTPYTKEMVEREIGNGENLASSDPGLGQYVRLITTDAGGNFVFDHVPAGEYYVCGLDEWSVAGDAHYQWACERVKVDFGESLHIKLSKNIQHLGRPALVLWALE